MSTGRLVAKNTLVQMIGKAVSTILGVAVIALVARALGRDGYGYYTTVITFLSFFGIVADLGLTLITAQMISERGADEARVVQSVFTFRIVSALILFGLAPVVAFFTPYSGLVKLGITLTAWSFFFVSLQQTLIGIFQKKLVMQFPLLSEVAGRVVLLLGTLYAVWSGKNLLWFLGAVVAGNIINFLLVQKFARQFVPIKLAWDWVVIKEMWRRSMPIAVSIIFNLVYLKADTLILSLVRTPAEVGLYGAAYRVVDVLMMLPIMVMGVVLPVATSSWTGGDGARVGRILQKTFDSFILYAAPILVGGILLASPIMALVAGREFAAAGLPLQILLLAFASATLSTLFGHFIVAIGQQRNVVWVYGLDAVLAAAAYLIFIPRFGSTAAAWATFGSELFAALVLGWVVLHHVQIKISLRITSLAILASLIMGVAVYAARFMSVWWPILIGVAIYGAIIFALRLPKKLL